ncbi:MAG: GNAT family N-acetyltransferase [Candidatus Diapherotrites archaeon]|nr:GNAT family N-acetyltransferase [Candidatus Diapherotrites archaeon]
MQITRVEEKDIPEILALIKKEFPYFQVGLEKIRERITSGRIMALKAVEKNALLGFIEAEFLEEGIARINSLTVKPEHRKEGVATGLLEEMLKQLELKGIERVLLLVKQSNNEAKKIYQQKGFQFVGLYQREIDGAVVEEMELDLHLGEGSPSYVT